MNMNKYRLGIDIGSTTVKIAILDDNNNILFSDYERHFANIQETLQSLLEKAVAQLGEFEIYPVITGSGGLTLAKHLEVPFTQEVVAVSTALVESSKIKTFGCFNNALAIHKRCFCPPETLTPPCPKSVSYPFGN